MKRRRNSDERLRQLEREANAGDKQAQKRLEAEYYRTGIWRDLERPMYSASPARVADLLGYSMPSGQTKEMAGKTFFQFFSVEGRQIWIHRKPSKTWFYIARPYRAGAMYLKEDGNFAEGLNLNIVGPGMGSLVRLFKTEKEAKKEIQKIEKAFRVVQDSLGMTPLELLAAKIKLTPWVVCDR